ncbi:MAG TPA: M20/M25/M40 family metallo-hydrolase, partial [Candidatus Eremiobacteraceae bacterium]|nr:M20/M25/M40 family metallo-hydrolase [Candidatus Eremiobacteraceae bacterium]
APPLLVSAHMDTVPPGKGVHPVREAGRIRTDGTTVLGGDDKSGLAVILEALLVLKEHGVPHGDIEVAFTICEEIGLLGAKHLDVGALRARRGFVLDSTHASLLFTRAPSSDHFEFTVHGLEAHAGVAPENGISAVRVAAEAIAAMPLGRIDSRTTSNVVIVESCIPTNVVPNRCVVRGESRSLSDARLDETTAAIRRSFQDAAGRATATVNGKLHRAWIEERCERNYESMDVPEDAPIVQLLLRAAKAAGRSIQTASIGGGSDANVFNRRGIETVNFGTGMRDIHTVNEWLDLDDFYACADVVLECIKLNAAS